MKPGKLSNAAGGGGIPTSGLRYPDKIINETTDYVEIQFYKYNPPFSTQGFSQSGLSGYNKSASELSSPIGGPVKLYMPQDISVQYGGNWQDMNISNIARSALGAAGDAFAGDVIGAAETVIGQMVSTIKNGIDERNCNRKTIIRSIRANKLWKFHC